VAERALPPGALRRRVAFGLLDADGWTWAGLKATFWFLFIVFMLGYIPNLAYYFTVSNTVAVGYNFASIVNWCPAANEDLPCPAPAGATLPWQTSPPELALPAARSGSAIFQSGTRMYLIGGRVDGQASAEVLVTEAMTDAEGALTGNLTPWHEGPALPEPRADAAVGVYVGIPYVLGGLDASGTPTDTVYKGVVEDGELVGWELADGSDGTDELTLPRPISGAAVVPGTSGFVLLGGRGADGEPTDGVHVAWVDAVSSSGRLLAWQPLGSLALPEPRADSVAAGVGDFIYLIGGEGPEGAVDSVFRLELVGQEPATDEVGEPLGWAVAAEESALPEARSDAIGFLAGGAVYSIGGFDADGVPQPDVYWTVPDATTGDLPGGWQHLDQTNLPVATADAPMAGVGSTAFIVGGDGVDGATDASMRAGLSPSEPFFQLGIAGATIPALSIKGEIGQQLGYLAAAGVATANFVILVILGIALSRPDSSKRVIARLSRGRLAMPPEDEYGP
jgi:hypothetical protein